MDEGGWFLSKPEGPAGPFLASDLQRMRAQGEISLEDLVWRDGMAAWVPFRDALGAASAPPPPAAPVAAPATPNPIATAEAPAPKSALAKNRRALRIGGALAILAILAGAGWAAWRWNEDRRFARLPLAALVPDQPRIFLEAGMGPFSGVDRERFLVWSAYFRKAFQTEGEPLALGEKAGVTVAIAVYRFDPNAMDRIDALLLLRGDGEWEAPPDISKLGRFRLGGGPGEAIEGWRVRTAEIEGRDTPFHIADRGRHVLVATERDRLLDAAALWGRRDAASFHRSETYRARFGEPTEGDTPPDVQFIDVRGILEDFAPKLAEVRDTAFAMFREKYLDRIDDLSSIARWDGSAYVSEGRVRLRDAGEFLREWRERGRVTWGPPMEGEDVSVAFVPPPGWSDWVRQFAERAQAGAARGPERKTRLLLASANSALSAHFGRNRGKYPVARAPTPLARVSLDEAMLARNRRKAPWGDDLFYRSKNGSDYRIEARYRGKAVMWYESTKGRVESVPDFADLVRVEEDTASAELGYGALAEIREFGAAMKLDFSSPRNMQARFGGRFTSTETAARVLILAERRDSGPSSPPMTLSVDGDWILARMSAPGGSASAAGAIRGPAEPEGAEASVLTVLYRFNLKRMQSAVPRVPYRDRPSPPEPPDETWETSFRMILGDGEIRIPSRFTPDPRPLSAATYLALFERLATKEWGTGLFSFPRPPAPSRDSSRGSRSGRPPTLGEGQAALSAAVY